MKEILWKLLHQSKHSRYKHLFALDVQEIFSFGIQNFIQILRKTHFSENKKPVRYFRLDDIYHEDYFSEEWGSIYIIVRDVSLWERTYELMRLFDTLGVRYKMLFSIEFTATFIEHPLFPVIQKDIKSIFYIHSLYSRFDLMYLEHHTSLFDQKEVLLWLDDVQTQEAAKESKILKIIALLKKKWALVNMDFIRLESAFKGIYVVGPKELHLDLYEYCNASCNFCVTNWPGFLNQRNERENHYKRSYSWNLYLNLFRKMVQAGTESIALGITWEPFLHPEIHAILTGLIDIPINVGFLTNGYKLLETMDLIVKNPHIKHFYINISAGNRESFERTRPKDNFQHFLDVWNWIRTLREKRPDIIVRGLYVITPENIDGIDDFIELCIQNNISELELKRVVPYEFSYEQFFFDSSAILRTITIVRKWQEKDISVHQNFTYIINDFLDVLENRSVQYPEWVEDMSQLVGKTTHCYNPYFYISIFRNTSFTCGKFEAAISKLPDLDLYEQIFEKGETRNILKAAKSIKTFLWEEKWKQKCSRCHHMDVNTMIEEYIKIKQIAVNHSNDYWS